MVHSRMCDVHLLPISAHVIPSLQSESDSFRYCMQTCAKAISFNVALQYGFSNIIALDRGYSGIKNTTDAADAGLRHLGGIKIYIGPFTDKLKVTRGQKSAKSTSHPMVILMLTMRRMC